MNAETSNSPGRDDARAISREELAKLPIRRYEGEICLAATQSELSLALADLHAEEVIGFDTETRPAFSKGERHLPCLVQAATARRVYLFQLRFPQVVETVAEMLGNAASAKVGVGLADDLRALKLSFSFEERNVIDLGVLARRRHMGQTGVRNLAGILLGYRIPKGARTSNWAAQRLSTAQINYAATDAWACREIFLQFRQRGWLQQRPDAVPGPFQVGAD